MKVFLDYTSLSDLSFGSLGIPSNLCSKAMLDWTDAQGTDSINMVFECAGETQVSEVMNSGIISYEGLIDYSGIVEIFAKCYYDPDNYDAYLFYFMQYFDAEAFNADLLDKCYGQQLCNATMSMDYFKGIPEEKRTVG